MNPVVIYEMPSTALAASANSGPISIGVGTSREFAFDATISALLAAHTITFYIDRLGADGNYYPVWNSTAQSAVGSVSASIGAGLGSAVTLGKDIQVRTVLSSGGTATCSISLIGK